MRDKSDNSVNIVCLHLSQRLAAALYALKRDELTKSDTSVTGSLSAPAGATCCESYCLIPAPVCAYLLFIKSNTCIFQLLWVQLSRMHACMHAEMGSWLRRRPYCSVSSCRGTAAFDDAGTFVDPLFSAHHLGAPQNEPQTPILRTFSTDTVTTA